ncbi:DedA family protein [Stackebrandtia endophytica]|uniref:DedA family protein n=1 Tax=Stackebrandtia endophytica TaxID=1496996 RepID=UPI001FE53334|nr:DedA family protein [Stackebrandtia endophytica]
MAELEHAIMVYLEGIMSSPWIYVAVFSIAFLDGFFPVVPGETSVIAAGTAAAALGNPNIALIILVAAVGAFCGDHVSYAIGRFGFSRIAKPGTKRQAAFEWARNALEERGGLVLVIARYIPGGRTAVTITCGAVHYPLRKFMFFDGIAAVSWALYSAGIGYFAGMIFESRPLLALLLGFSVAMTIAGIVELVRFLKKRRAKKAGELATAGTVSVGEPAASEAVAVATGSTETSVKNP